MSKGHQAPDGQDFVELKLLIEEKNVPENSLKKRQDEYF